MIRMAVVTLGALVAMGCKGGEKAEPPAPPAAASAPAPESAAPAPGEGTFAALEGEIFGPKCAYQTGCHTGSAPAGKLNLSPGHAYQNLVNVKAERRPERLRVTPGDPDGSYLLQRLSPGGDTPRMPFGGSRLPAAELDRIRVWIRDGARP